MSKRLRRGLWKTEYDGWTLVELGLTGGTIRSEVKGLSNSLNLIVDAL